VVVAGHEQDAADAVARPQMAHERRCLDMRLVVEPEQRRVVVVDDHHALQSRFGRRQRRGGQIGRLTAGDAPAASLYGPAQTVAVLLADVDGE
jgi:hypothetical protein